MCINASDYKNQKEIILAHIKQYGNISTIEGYNIITKIEYNKDKTKHYARYFLKEGVKNEIL